MSSEPADYESPDTNSPSFEAGDYEVAKVDSWREIELLLEEVTELSKSELSLPAFCELLLDKTVITLGAVGGAVWSRQGNVLQIIRHQGMERSGLQAVAALADEHDRLIRAAVADPQPRSLDPRADWQAGPAKVRLLLQPLSVDGEVVGVLELFHEPQVDVERQRNAAQVLAALGELVSDFHRNRQLCEFRERDRSWREFQQLTEALHQGLKLRPTAFVLVNEARRWIGCDRVALAVVRRGRAQLYAVSGVDRFDRRSSTVAGLERLIRAVLTANEPLNHEGDTTAYPPQLEEPLSRYLAQSPFRMLSVLPLYADQRKAGGEKQASETAFAALVVESFSDERASEQRRRAEQVCRQASLALANAQEYESLPLLSVMRAMRSAAWFTNAQRLPRVALAAMLLLVVVLALVLTPAELRIAAEGVLNPREVRDVFAPSDGNVQRLLVAYDDQVAEDQPLVLLRSTDLDVERQRLEGLLAANREKLSGIESNQLVGATADTSTGELAASASEVRQLIEAYQRQVEIVSRQIDELNVTSPIAGRVFTWQLAKRLEARPLKRGQVMMSIANLDGAWQLEVLVPDYHAGHVLSAGERLNVSFVLATDPSRVYHGTTRDISANTQTGESETPSVAVKVDVDKPELPQLRAGAVVSARIHCGEKSLGYVWFHDLVDAVWSRLVF